MRKITPRWGLWLVLFLPLVTGGGARAAGTPGGLEGYLCTVRAPAGWRVAGEAEFAWLPAGDFLAGWQREAPPGALGLFVVGWRHPGQASTAMLAEAAADHLEGLGLELTCDAVVTAGRRAYRMRCTAPGQGLALNALTGGTGEVNTVLYLTVVGNAWQQQDEGGDVLTIGAVGPAGEQAALLAAYEALLASLQFTGQYQPPPVAAPVAYRGFLRELEGTGHRRLALVVGASGPAGVTVWRFPSPPAEETVCLCLGPDGRSAWILTGAQARRLGTVEGEALRLRQSPALEPYRNNWAALVGTSAATPGG